MLILKRAFKKNMDYPHSCGYGTYGDQEHLTLLLPDQAFFFPLNMYTYDAMHIFGFKSYMGGL